MAEPSIYDLKDATMYLVDGTSTPKTLEIKFDEGTLQFSEKKEREFRLNRGDLETGAVRDGDDQPCEVSFEGRFNAVTSSSGDPVTVMEFLKQTGAASAHATTGDACEPYCIDIQLQVDHNCNDVDDEIVTFSKFYYEDISGDFGAGTLGVSGRCKSVGPTAIRTTLA